MSIGRLIGISILFAAPATLVLAALAALGWLEAGTALLAGLAAAGSTAVVLMYYHDAVQIGRWLDRLARGDERARRPPRPVSELGRLLTGTIVRLHRGWRGQNRRLTVQLETASAILEAMHDPLVVLDRARVVTRANEAALRLFGDKMKDRDLAESLRHPEVLEAVDAVLRDGAPREVAFTQPVPIEQVFELRVKRFEPLPVEGGEPAEDEPASATPAVLMTLHDITAIKRSEQMRADFVANASHELRTPLSTLIGFIETLRGPAHDDPEARDRFLGIMDEQALRMSRLVNDLLSLSRIELDEHTAPTGRVDLARLLAAVADALEMRAQARNITLELALPEGLPAVIGDDDQLTQVFQNLIDNAIKYGRPDSTVTVAARPVGPGGERAGASVAVAVIDRGEGIARSHLPRLTERFYRVDPARSRAVGGTGLGLAIVKHIVSRHRGRLTIESEVGRGSTFTVHLPVAPAASPRAEARHRAAARTGPTGAVPAGFSSARKE